MLSSSSSSSCRRQPSAGCATSSSVASSTSSSSTSCNSCDIHGQDEPTIVFLTEKHQAPGAPRKEETNTQHFSTSVLGNRYNYLEEEEKCSNQESDSIRMYNDTYMSITQQQKKYHSSGNSTSNVLGFAFYSFFIFTCVQAFYAVQSHSSSLLADTAAMFVDAMTYLFNMLAETYKATMMRERSNCEAKEEIYGTRSKLQKMYLELLPPVFSIVALLYITCMSLMDAIVVLYGHYCISNNNNHNATNSLASLSLLGGGEGNQMDEEPNTKIMMIFAFAALVIDLLNVSCFSTATTTTSISSRHDDPYCHDSWQDVTQRTEDVSIYDCECPFSPTLTFHDVSPVPSTEHTPLVMGSSPIRQQQQQQQQQQLPCFARRSSCSCEEQSQNTTYYTHTVGEGLDVTNNMNMYSAWTHVFADTLRSTAILLAGILSHFYPHFILPVISDAVAAIIVSCTIFFSCVPLIKGLHQTWYTIRTLKRSAYGS